MKTRYGHIINTNMENGEIEKRGKRLEENLIWTRCNIISFPEASDPRFPSNNITSTVYTIPFTCTYVYIYLLMYLRVFAFGNYS